MKSALKIPGKSLKALNSSCILLFSVGLSPVDIDLNHYKIVVLLFGGFTKKGTNFILIVIY